MQALSDVSRSMMPASSRATMVLGTATLGAALALAMLHPGSSHAAETLSGNVLETFKDFLVSHASWLAGHLHAAVGGHVFACCG